MTDEDALAAVLVQIDRAFGKGSPEPEPEPRKESRPWWQVGWRVSRFMRAKDTRPKIRRRERPVRNKSWAPWFGQRVGERRWPDAPF